VTSPRVAVVDSDSGFTHVLISRMRALGWEHVEIAPEHGTLALRTERITAAVVDPFAIAAPDWERCLELAVDALRGTPLVVCAGPSTTAQRVRGLRLGADDWVNKPCHPEEVIARIEAIARRQRSDGRGTNAQATVHGELEIHPGLFQAVVGEESAELTRREFEVLSELAQAQGQALEREDLYRRVWGYRMAHGDRSVDVFVRKIRQKLAIVSPHWEYIHTHFGVGYRFDPQLADPVAADADERP